MISKEQFWDDLTEQVKQWLISPREKYFTGYKRCLPTENEEISYADYCELKEDWRKLGDEHGMQGRVARSGSQRDQGVMDFCFSKAECGAPTFTYHIKVTGVNGTNW